MFGMNKNSAYLLLTALMSIAPTSIMAMNNNFEEEREDRVASSSMARDESPDNDSDRSSLASDWVFPAWYLGAVRMAHGLGGDLLFVVVFQAAVRCYTVWRLQ